MAVPGGLIPESVCSRFAKYQEERFESLAASDDRLAFELQTVHRPGLQLLALEATQKLVLVVPLDSISLEPVHGQLAALNPQQPLHELAAFLESEMKVKAMYSLQNGKLTSGAPQLDTFLPPQLQQLIGNVEVSWQSGICLSEYVAAVAAKVEQKVAAAAVEFAGRQQLFTHLADEIGWPLRIDDAQQRWAAYSVQLGKSSAVLYVEADTFPSKPPRLSLQAPGGSAAHVLRFPQYDWSDRWPPSRMAQQIKSILNKQLALLPVASRS